MGWLILWAIVGMVTFNFFAWCIQTGGELGVIFGWLYIICFLPIWTMVGVEAYKNVK